MRYTGPKNKLARREGIDLGLKTSGSRAQRNLLKKIAVPPGQHGVSRRRGKLTDYSIQLREKQKLKRLYGISEKQMKNYFRRASRKIGNTADFLIQYLETRLDNIVYKLGFAPTRAAARQLVSHGHISVNSKRIDIPSYEVKINEPIGFVKDRSFPMPDIVIPSHLERKENEGKLTTCPKREDLPEVVNVQSVVEFYSR